jgi:hypothetical protein
MQNAELTQHLILLEERMRAIEAALIRVESPSALSLVASRLGAIDKRLDERVPVADIQAAIEDVLDTRFEMGELRELYTNQRDALAAHFTLIDAVLREFLDLSIQLRELGRKHVRGLADLERAAEWHESEAERRDVAWTEGDEERRKAG